MKLSRLVHALAQRDGMYSQLKAAAASHLNAPSFLCPNCGFYGKFKGFGNPVRTAAMCPKCSALERHRLLALAFQRNVINLAGKDVLHFAPESTVRTLVEKSQPSTYVRSNYPEAQSGEVSLNIEQLAIPSDHFDVVLCSHVLEHIDDSKALPELFRIIRPNGALIFMIPIIEGWAVSYEDASIISEADRTLHFGQNDHVRFYGADIRSRVASAGFSLFEFTAEGLDSVKYGLLRGEKVFIAKKQV